jgi:hypothetical protein
VRIGVRGSPGLPAARSKSHRASSISCGFPSTPRRPLAPVLDENAIRGAAIVFFHTTIVISFDRCETSTRRGLVVDAVHPVQATVHVNVGPVLLPASDVSVIRIGTSSTVPSLRFNLTVVR